MDISRLATKDSANEGRWFTVILYGEEQDFQLNILGDDSDAVAEYIRDKLKKNADKSYSKSKTNRVTDEEIDELLDMSRKDILIRINGIRGLKRDSKGKIISHDEPVVLFDRKIKNNDTDFAFLIEEIPALKGFIADISRERTNFLSDRKKNSNEPSGGSSSSGQSEVGSREAE